VTAAGQARIREVFARARDEHRAALIGYLPAGYPSVAAATDAMAAMVDAGVDLVEVGLPYSDPLMDGPVIQQAVDAALRAGTTTADVLGTVESLAARGIPSLVMSYWNPIEHYGAARFATDLATAGGLVGAVRGFRAAMAMPPASPLPWLQDNTLSQRAAAATQPTAATHHPSLSRSGSRGFRSSLRRHTSALAAGRR
jgi:tryptophan synthase alpha chain